MANDIIIPPSVADGVDALSNLPGPDEALSMFGNDIAGGFNTAIDDLAGVPGDGGANDVLGKISSIIGGSPTAHVDTVAALVLIETMYTTIITAGAQSTDMVEHVGHLQNSMPLVLKKASTANAMVVATAYVSPDCSSNIIFPIGGSGTDITTAVAGTATESGDVLQGDVQTAIEDLNTILNAPFGAFVPPGSPVPSSYTAGLNALLDDIIIGDNSVNHSIVLGYYDPANYTGMVLAYENITTKGNSIDTAVFEERANVGLPNLDGSAIIEGGTIVVPGVPDVADAGKIQMGAGRVTADIKKKALGLQAHAMAGTPCQKNILTRSAPDVGSTEEAGISSIAGKADTVGVEDENDFSLDDDPTIAVAEEEAKIVEEVDQAAEDGDNIATLDTIVWKSETQKITALIYNSEKGLKFKARLEIPAQNAAMVAKFPELGVSETILSAEWVYPESMVITDFFGNNMMKNSLKGQLSSVVADNLYTALYKEYGSLTKYGISVFKNNDTKLDAAVLSFIPDPDMVGFDIKLSMLDIDNLDPTTDPNSVGNCKTVIFDGNIKKGNAIGPVEGNDTGFWFVKTHINTNTAFTTWIESDDDKLKDAAIKYLDKLTV